MANGTVQWIDGNAEQQGYSHIGETGKVLSADGNENNGINLNADGSATNIQTGKNATASVSGKTQIVTKSEVDGGTANATIRLVGGVTEVILGALSTESGVSIYGIVDGSIRVALNAVRLGVFLEISEMQLLVILVDWPVK